MVTPCPTPLGPLLMLMDPICGTPGTKYSDEGMAGSCTSCSRGTLDRKSTRLNSSHRTISYAVFCLKKKNHLTSRSLLSIHHFYDFFFMIHFPEVHYLRFIITIPTDWFYVVLIIARFLLNYNSHATL